MGRPKQTHCARGHALIPENVYTSPRGSRYCRICKKTAADKHIDSGQQCAAQRKYRYGVTPKKYEEMLKESDGRCAVCHRLYEIPIIDHDHETKKVREILCRFCNTGLGMFGDNIAVLENAIAYLRKHGD